MLHFFWNDSPYIPRQGDYQKPEFSNYEIPKWAEFHLGQQTEFHQSFWNAGRVTTNPNDILLGHPSWDHKSNSVMLNRNWMMDNSIGNRKIHPNSYILFPWVPKLHLNWIDYLVYPDQLLYANKIFALCGKHWIDQTLLLEDESIPSRVKHKLVHVNMGIAADNYRIRKKQFRPIGQRQLLHISNFASYKRTNLLFDSLQGIQNTKLNIISTQNWSPNSLLQIGYRDDKKFTFYFYGVPVFGDEMQEKWIVENCDFYIHTSDMDSQATVILENIARGLVPLVTPESGFDGPDAIYLTLDPDENKKIIRWALELPEDELMNRSIRLQEYIRKHHNWKDIYQRIWDVICDDIAERKHQNTIL